MAFIYELSFFRLALDKFGTMTRSSVCVGAEHIVGKSFVCRELFGSLDRIQLKLDLECSWNRLVDQCCRRWNFDFRFRCPSFGGNFDWIPGERDLDVESQESLEVERKDSAGKFVHRIISPIEEQRLEVFPDWLERHPGAEASREAQKNRTSATKEDCERLLSCSDDGTSNRNAQSVETDSNISFLPGFGIPPHSDPLVVPPPPLNSEPPYLPHSLTRSVSPILSSPTNTPFCSSFSSRPLPDSPTPPSPSAFINPMDSRSSHPERKRKSPGEGRSNTVFILQYINNLEYRPV